MAKHYLRQNIVNPNIEADIIFFIGTSALLLLSIKKVNKIYLHLPFYPFFKKNTFDFTHRVALKLAQHLDSPRIYNKRIYVQG